MSTYKPASGKNKLNVRAELTARFKQLQEDLGAELVASEIPDSDTRAKLFNASIKNIEVAYALFLAAFTVRKVDWSESSSTEQVLVALADLAEMQTLHL